MYSRRVVGGAPNRLRLGTATGGVLTVPTSAMRCQSGGGWDQHGGGGSNDAWGQQQQQQGWQQQGEQHHHGQTEQQQFSRGGDHHHHQQGFQQQESWSGEADAWGQQQQQQQSQGYQQQWDSQASSQEQYGGFEQQQRAGGESSSSSSSWHDQMGQQQQQAGGGGMENWNQQQQMTNDPTFSREGQAASDPWASVTPVGDVTAPPPPDAPDSNSNLDAEQGWGSGASAITGAAAPAASSKDAVDEKQKEKFKMTEKINKIKAQIRLSSSLTEEEILNTNTVSLMKNPTQFPEDINSLRNRFYYSIGTDNLVPLMDALGIILTVRSHELMYEPGSRADKARKRVESMMRSNFHIFTIVGDFVMMHPSASFSRLSFNNFMLDRDRARRPVGIEHHRLYSGWKIDSETARLPDHPVSLKEFPFFGERKYDFDFHSDFIDKFQYSLKGEGTVQARNRHEKDIIVKALERTIYHRTEEVIHRVRDLPYGYGIRSRDLKSVVFKEVQKILKEVKDEKERRAKLAAEKSGSAVTQPPGGLSSSEFAEKWKSFGEPNPSPETLKQVGVDPSDAVVPSGSSGEGEVVKLTRLEEGALLDRILVENGYSSLDEALKEVQHLHYMLKGDLIAMDWKAQIIWAVCHIPVEGCSEEEFKSLVMNTNHIPRKSKFEDRFSSGTSFIDWIDRFWTRYVDVDKISVYGTSNGQNHPGGDGIPTTSSADSSSSRRVDAAVDHYGGGLGEFSNVLDLDHHTPDSSDSFAVRIRSKMIPGSVPPFPKSVSGPLIGYGNFAEDVSVTCMALDSDEGRLFPSTDRVITSPPAEAWHVPKPSDVSVAAPSSANDASNEQNEYSSALEAAFGTTSEVAEVKQSENNVEGSSPSHTSTSEPQAAAISPANEVPKKTRKVEEAKVDEKSFRLSAGFSLEDVISLLPRQAPVEYHAKDWYELVKSAPSISERARFSGKGSNIRSTVFVDTTGGFTHEAFTEACNNHGLNTLLQSSPEKKENAFASLIAVRQADTPRFGKDNPDGSTSDIVLDRISEPSQFIPSRVIETLSQKRSEVGVQYDVVYVFCGNNSLLNMYHDALERLADGDNQIIYTNDKEGIRSGEAQLYYDHQQVIESSDVTEEEKQKLEDNLRDPLKRRRPIRGSGFTVDGKIIEVTLVSPDKKVTLELGRHASVTKKNRTVTAAAGFFARQSVI